MWTHALKKVKEVFTHDHKYQSSMEFGVHGGKPVSDCDLVTILVISGACLHLVLMCISVIQTQTGHPTHITIYTCVYHASPADHLCSDFVTSYDTSARRSNGPVHSYYIHTLANCSLAFSLVTLVVVKVQLDIPLSAEFKISPSTGQIDGWSCKNSSNWSLN